MTDRKDIVPPKAGDITPISNIEKQLTDLKTKYEVVPDVTTKEGYKACKAGIQELVTMRTGTEKAKLAITKHHRDFVSEVNALAKSLITEVSKLEAPLKDAKLEVDDRIERQNEARKQKIRDEIVKEITSYIDSAQGQSSGLLMEMVEALRFADVSRYGELEAEADTERHRVIGVLSTMAMDAMKRFNDEAERRRELDAQQSAWQAAGHGEVPGKAKDYVPGQPFDTWRDTPVSDEASTSEVYDEALADLAEIVGPDLAEDTLIAIMGGDIRHVTCK
jgi:hypothetical protein